MRPEQTRAYSQFDPFSYIGLSLMCIMCVYAEWMRFDTTTVQIHNRLHKTFPHNNRFRIQWPCTWACIGLGLFFFFRFSNKFGLRVWCLRSGQLYRLSRLQRLCLWPPDSGALLMVCAFWNRFYIQAKWLIFARSAHRYLACLSGWGDISRYFWCLHVHWAYVRVYA